MSQIVMVKTELAKRIKESGLKKDAVAKKMGVSIFTITNWCRGSTCPNLRQARDLKYILNLNYIDEMIEPQKSKLKDIRDIRI